LEAINIYTCAYCQDESCKKEKPDNYPTNCPTLEKEEFEKIKKIALDIISVAKERYKFE